MGRDADEKVANSGFPDLYQESKPQAPASRDDGVGIPEFLLRKLYRRGSLRESSAGHFRFTLENVLGSATIIAPPRIVVNGIAHAPERVDSPRVKVSTISPAQPFEFRKGDLVTLLMPGSLLRGGNRIQVFVKTKEFGELAIEAEDRAAEFCDFPGAGIDPPEQ